MGGFWRLSERTIRCNMWRIEVQEPFTSRGQAERVCGGVSEEVPMQQWHISVTQAVGRGRAGGILIGRPKMGVSGRELVCTTSGTEHCRSRLDGGRVVLWCSEQQQSAAFSGY